MDGDKETNSGSVPGVTVEEKRNIFPLQPNMENTLPQPLNKEQPMQLGKPYASTGMETLGTTYHPEVLNSKPQAVPQSVEKTRSKHGFKATLARVVLPIMTLFGATQIPPETQTTIITAPQVIATKAIQTTQYAVEAARIYSDNMITGGNPRLGADPSMKAAIPGPLDKAQALYSAPGPSSLPNK